MEKENENATVVRIGSAETNGGQQHQPPCRCEPGLTIHDRNVLMKLYIIWNFSFRHTSYRQGVGPSQGSGSQSPASYCGTSCGICGEHNVVQRPLFFSQYFGQYHFCSAPYSSFTYHSPSTGVTYS